MGAFSLLDPAAGTNLADRQSNAGQNIDGQTPDDSNRHTLEDNGDNDADSVTSDYVIESMAINPNAFTFGQIIMSPIEAALRKLVDLESRAVHHIYKVIEYGIDSNTVSTHVQKQRKHLRLLKHQIF